MAQKDRPGVAHLIEQWLRVGHRQFEVLRSDVVG